jgi:hypothetical protein
VLYRAVIVSETQIRPVPNRSPPDREPVLRETWLTVIKLLGVRKLAIGGKSMGGRIASLVADEADVAGLVCVGCLRQKGLDVIMQHAGGFIRDRLAPLQPRNDGHQTPIRGHPVFVAQHSTATCCRSCLSKWHGVEKGKPLDALEVDYVVGVIRRWLELHRDSR